LSSLKEGEQRTFTGVLDHSTAFLKYLDKAGIALGNTLKVKSIEQYDQTYTLTLNSKKEVVVSNKVANSILVS